MRIRSINPYNGKTLDTYEELDGKALRSKISRSHDAFLEWKKSSYDLRASLLNNCADHLESNKDSYGRIITLEMGKIIRESIAEVEKCAAVCRYYAENGHEFLEDQPLKTSSGEAYIHYNPLGPVLAVMPWNFPFWQVFRFAAPAVMAGNTALLKHASNVPQSALAIEKSFLEAGFPEGVFQTLLIGASKVPEVLANQHVKAATLTGSEPAGSKVAECAGKHLKKTVLELGGSDPFIILADADLTTAAKTAVKARMINTGQSCIAAKRFIIQEAVYDTFVGLFTGFLKDLRSGDPMDTSTDYGPLARKDLAEEIHQQVTESIRQGANLLYGDLPAEINDAWYPPLVLDRIPRESPAYREEIFGPVATFFKYRHQEEAVEIANDTMFGLGASLWTADGKKAKELAHQIETGAVYCNQMMFSDPTVPFGGVKNSGYGRELSHLGIREFTNQKTVWIAE